MDDQNNPWFVNNLEEFLYYCCPECNEKNRSQDLFLEHAMCEHPRAKEYLKMFEVKKEIGMYSARNLEMTIRFSL